MLKLRFCIDFDPSYKAVSNPNLLSFRLTYSFSLKTYLLDRLLAVFEWQPLPKYCT